jgi:anti-anti-sigma regulatory factor
MQAHYYEVGDMMVVEVTGRIEPDQNKPFRDICEKKLKGKKVVFCLDKLNFTASANITTFFESIRLIEDARLVGLRADFHKLLDLKGITGIKNFTSLSEAINFV